MKTLLASLLVVFSSVVYSQYDVDGDGQQNALTDGLMITRYLFGFKPPVLCKGAIEPYNNNRCNKIQERIETGTSIKGCTVKDNLVICKFN